MKRRQFISWLGGAGADPSGTPCPSTISVWTGPCGRG